MELLAVLAVLALLAVLAVLAVLLVLLVLAMLVLMALLAMLAVLAEQAALAKVEGCLIATKGVQSRGTMITVLSANSPLLACAACENPESILALGLAFWLMGESCL